MSRHHWRGQRYGKREPRCRHPRSLFGRLALIWLLGLAVVLAVSSWIYLGERGRAARNTMFEHMALDVVTVVALMDSLPATEREAALKRLERSHYRFVLAPLPEGKPLGDDFAHPAWSKLRDGLAGRRLEMRAALAGDHPHRALYLGTRLADGSPFLVEAQAPVPTTPPARSSTTSPSNPSAIACLSRTTTGIIRIVCATAIFSPAGLGTSANAAKSSLSSSGRLARRMASTNTSAARGSGFAILNGERKDLRYRFTYQGLSGTLTAGGHFHTGARTRTGPVVKGIALSGDPASATVENNWASSAATVPEVGVGTVADTGTAP